MRFAISLPQRFPDGSFDPGAFRAYLQEAEDLGFHSAWTHEQTRTASPTLGPLETMTFAAACTSRLRLGCAVLVTPRYHPLHLAKSITSLDQFSRGRIEIGVGLGGKAGLENFGIAPDRLVTRFTEGIELMKACWTRPAIDLDGQIFQVRDALMEPKPFQKPHPPLWIGGHSPAAIRRAVRHGDGFIGAGGATTAAFTEQVGLLRAELAEAGRDASSYPVAKRVYISVDEDADRARERLFPTVQSLYGRTDTTVTGTPEDCVRGLREVAAAGANLIVLDTLHDTDQMRALARNVLPALA